MRRTPDGEAYGLQEAISGALAQLVEEKGWTDAEVCERAGISPGAWRNIRAGNGGMSSCDAVARALGRIGTVDALAVAVAWAHNLAAGGKGPMRRGLD